MDQIVADPSVATDDEIERQPAWNDRAHISTTLGIVGVVMVGLVIALAASAVITALTTPDFMVDDFTDDPFAATCAACVLPTIVGGFGVVFGILGLRGVPVHGERRVAIRGLLFGILSVLVPIAVGVVMNSFDQATAACGGG